MSDLPEGFSLYTAYYLDGRTPETRKLWDLPARTIYDAIEDTMSRLKVDGVEVLPPDGIQVVRFGEPPLDMVVRHQKLWGSFIKDRLRTAHAPSLTTEFLEFWEDAEHETLIEEETIPGGNQ